MAVFSAACLDACRAAGLEVARRLDGTLVTSIDAHGASLSLLRLDDDDDDRILDLLDAPCDSPALGPGLCFRKVVDAPALFAAPRAALDDEEEEEDDDDSREGKKTYLAAQAPALRRGILAACDAVERVEGRLTELDSAVGDGDCGTTLAAGASAVRADVLARPEVYAGSAPRALGAIARVVSTTMGGSSGALYTLGFRAAETALKTKAASLALAVDAAAAAAAADALKEAYVAFAQAISECGGAGVGSATMCDATLPAADVLARKGHLAEAADAAKRGADSTAVIHATHGRSAHVAKDKQLGVPDPGAVAVAEMFAAVAAEFPHA